MGWLDGWPVGQPMIDRLLGIGRLAVYWWINQLVATSNKVTEIFRRLRVSLLVGRLIWFVECVGGLVIRSLIGRIG